MAKKSNITHEEIDSIIEELVQKIDILKMRYDQFFMGKEKLPPNTLRTDVVRIMRSLENTHIRNTASKFKFRSAIQKFNTYSTYWNRTLREIEEGKYKRGTGREIIQKINLHTPQKEQKTSPGEQEHNKYTTLYSELNNLRTKLGLPKQKLNHKEFSDRIDAETKKLQERFPNKNINFRAVIKDGKPQIQPYIS